MRVRLLFVILCISGGTASAACPAALQQPGVWGGLDLLPGGRCALTLPSLTAYQVQLEQGGADFLIEIRETGMPVRVVDAFEFGVETVTLTGVGEGRLVVIRAPGTRGPAPARVRIVQLSEDMPVTQRIAAEDRSTRVSMLRKKNRAEDLRQALEESAGALMEWQLLNDIPSFSRAVLARGELLFALGRQDESVQAFGEALEGFRQSVDSYGMASCLNDRGFAQVQQGMLPAGFADLRAAVDLRRKGKQWSGLAAALNNLGLAYLQSGMYTEAVRSFAEAKPLFEREGPARGRWILIHNLAGTYFYLGEFSLAATHFGQAAQGLIGIGEFGAAAASLASSARAHLRLNQAHLAEANAQRGLALAERGGDPRSIGAAQNLLSEVMRRLGRLDVALKLEAESLERLRAGNDRRGQANVLVNLGLTLRAYGRTDESVARFREALELLRATGAPVLEAAALYHLSFAQRDAADLTGAKQSIQSAIEIADRLRGNVAGEDLRVSFLGSIHAYYEAAVDLLMETGLRGDSSALIEAFRIAERGKSRVLYDAIRRVRPSQAQAVAAWERLRQIDALVTFEVTQLGRAPSAQEARRQHLEALFAERSALEERLGALDPRFAVAGSNVEVSLEDLRSQVIDQDTAVIEYFVGDKRSFAWRIDHQSITGRELPGRTTLDREVAMFMAGLRKADGTPAPADAFARAASPLARSILSPLEGAQAKRLVIVTDAALNRVPFSALPDSRGGQLVDKWEVISVPSLATALALRQRRARRPLGSGAAIFFDPVFDANDTRFATSPKQANNASNEKYLRLAFSRHEGEEVAKLFEGRAIELLRGFQVTRDALLSGRFRDTDLLHFSTHGSADGRRPVLIFSQYWPDGRIRQGIVSSREIGALDLNARLVVLSACETAAGPYAEGEGTMSLSRALLAAGADRVLASMWRVDDEATAALLVHFYRGMLINSLSPATALRRAQLAVRRDPRWRAPVYWAPLVLAGAP